MTPDEDDDRTFIRPPSARTRAEPSTAAPSASVGAFPPTLAGTPAVSTVPPGGATTMAQSTPHALTLPAGARIAEFEVTKTIGEGGFGIVYLAWDHSLERKVALKEYMPSSIATRVGQTDIRPRSDRHQETFDVGLRSFINEARLLAQFDHASLLKVYRFWEANGTAYMVMPFLEGPTLRDTVRGLAEPPDEAWIVALLVPLFDALAMLHAAKCYHRDIAPDNILLLAENGRPLLLDFGAARRVIGEATQALTAILKPGYAPVEQYAEIPGLKQGPWTDIYALAAVVHWMVTGKTPSPSVGRLFDDAHVPLAERLAGRYSAHFLEAIDRALVVMPAKRTQTVEAFRDELLGEGVAGGIAPSSPDAPFATGMQARDASIPVSRTQGRTAFPPTRQATVARDARTAPLPSTTGPAQATRMPWLWIGLAGLVVAGVAAFALWPAHRDANGVAATGTIVPASPASASAPVVTSSPPPANTTPDTAPVVAPAAQPQAPTQAPTQTQTPPASTRTATPAVPPVVTAPAITPVTVPDAVAKTPARDPAARPAEPRERPVERPAKKPARSDNDETSPAAATARPASDNQAECAKLFQRLSLGDTDPGLTDRVRTLHCR